jgi:predicted RNA-binding Zn-ribbon protein involved in translation (DUF1610 family)
MDEIAFFCAKCGVPLVFPSASAGAMVLCPHCGNDTPCPERSVPEAEKEIIRFYCPKCGIEIAAPRKTVGQRGSCSACKAEFVVPKVARRAVQPPPSGSASARTLFGFGIATQIIGGVLCAADAAGIGCFFLGLGGLLLVGSFFMVLLVIARKAESVEGLLKAQAESQRKDEGQER